jgi:hypothetical protein
MTKHLGMFFLIGCGLALLVLGCNQQQKPTFDVTAMKNIIGEKTISLQKPI